jgi:hypothetical protein
MKGFGTQTHYMSRWDPIADGELAGDDVVDERIDAGVNVQVVNTGNGILSGDNPHSREYHQMGANGNYGLQTWRW